MVKLIRKTYAVKGLMDLHLQLNIGNPVCPYVKVAFTGGQLTGYGVTPARLTTTDPFLQRLIESRDDFYDPKRPRRDKNGDVVAGRIFLLKEEEVRDEDRKQTKTLTDAEDPEGSGP